MFRSEAKRAPDSDVATAIYAPENRDERSRYPYNGISANKGGKGGGIVDINRDSLTRIPSSP